MEAAFARNDGAAKVLVDLHPFGKQSRIYASIKPSACHAHQYGETLNLPVGTDGSPVLLRGLLMSKTCGSYIACQRDDTDSQVNH
jgi:hypothetical protein